MDIDKILYRVDDISSDDANEATRALFEITMLIKRMSEDLQLHTGESNDAMYLYLQLDPDKIRPLVNRRVNKLKQELAAWMMGS